MTITVTSHGVQTKSASSTDVVFPSFTPAAGSMLLLIAGGGGTLTINGITGHTGGAAWTQVKDIPGWSTANRDFKAWACFVGGSPSASAVTIDINYLDTGVFELFELAGVDTSGTVTNAFGVDGSEYGYDLEPWTATLAAFSSATNMTFCVGMQIDATPTFTWDGNLTTGTLRQLGTWAQQCAWVDAEDNSVAFNSENSKNGIIWATEIKAAAAAGVEAKPTVYGVDFGHSLCPDHLYMMDEGTGSTLTDKGKTGGLNLAITGADWTTDPTHGNVLDFVGANTDYAEVAVSGLTGTHTLCALVYASAGSVQRTIASFCDSGDFDRYVALVYQADEDLEAISRFDATAVTNTSTTDIPADTWSLVFMRFSDTTIDWSLNGSAWTTQAVSHSGLVAAINRFTVGYRNTSSPGNPWDDQMAALMWWRSSLSDANIASIAADPWQYLTPGGAHKLIGKFGGKLRGKI